ncbi:MAG TPA: signal recognition particle-docking protein FtsY [Firmicutes bacterium]|jgi:fused signal recognition particle receptor|nr:signal recognition particle-docking protein FtsY [Bacillota bacterium]HBE06610.1 signal recognition particle-docking protein FtsY [Bacillota bacterium]HBG44749.1 signal recognition particle-docking protein FtsY [Bacillota bacterium]HBL50305.1 signal recognition particle-docking protein FtsY [Bacillota bacterium]HCM18902.1 signal recognition particle-docking protein FtsY [Bacillota bacterium]
MDGKTHNRKWGGTDLSGGMFARLVDGLEKTRHSLVEQVRNITLRSKKLDEDFFEELEETLILADVGVEATEMLVKKLRTEIHNNRVSEPDQVMAMFKKMLTEILSNHAADAASVVNAAAVADSDFPAAWMVVGVNGVGKTTTIGKLAALHAKAGKKVLLGAGDTFRAAAIDQLDIWAQRAGCEIVKHQEGSDPAAVAFDTIQAAKARKSDLVLLDTAGRLHTKVNLMEELRKVHRVVTREAVGFRTEVLLVLDATTGQNAIEQAKIFKEAVAVSGVALTKLDGTAKGGVIIAIAGILGIPIKYIGVGERPEDLREFHYGEFIEALFA